MDGRITSKQTGARLSHVMERCGVSRRRLAEISGLSYPTVKRMCEDDCTGTIASWLAVADALDVHISELLEVGNGK